MSEPIKIGGQTFIRTDKGWIDQKTKVKAPEGLIPLLDKVAEEQSPEGMKKRAILDNSYVVKFGDSEYVWDMNNQVFVDKKTKNPVPKHLSSILEAAAGMKKASAEDKKKVATDAINNMGSTGQAAKQKVKKPTGKGQLPAPNIKINSPIVTMIEKLAVIDSYLQQRLNNQKLLAAKNVAAAREQKIETPEVDAQPEIDEEKIDAQVEEENKKSNAAMIAVAVGAVGLIASQFDPVREAFSSVVDFAKGVYSYVSRFVGFMNESLESMTGRTPPSTSAGSAAPAGSSAATPSQATPANPSTTASATSGEAAPSSAPAAASSATPAGTGNTPTASRSSAAAASTVGGSAPPPPAPASNDIVVTARRPSDSSRTTTPSSSSPSTDATRTSAPPPASVSPAPAAPIPDWLSSAPLGTVWQGGGFMVKKEVNGTYSIRAPGNEWVTGESASNARHYIETARLNASSGSQYNPGGVIAGPDPVDGYINPVEGYSINSAYGMRNHPTEGGNKFHTGVDIAAPEGTPVRAVKGGTVSKISNNQRPYRGFGNAVIIDHGDGYQTVYAHLSKFACREGDRVQQGQIIGYVGSTGMSTGAHLHFIVQKTGIAVPNAGNTVNPATLLRAGGVTIPAGMEGYDMESGGAGSNALQQAASAGWAMTEGAIEAVGNILRAAIDSGNMETVGLGTQMSDMTTAQSINRAAQERNAEIAAARSADEPTAAAGDPLNLSSSGGSSTIQNLPTGSDLAGVEFYLTRMGFPRIEYTQTASRTTTA